MPRLLEVRARNPVLLALLMVALLTASACSREETGPALPDSPKTFAAERGALETPPDETEASGAAAAERARPARAGRETGAQWFQATTEAARTSTLTAEVAGLVEVIEVDEGQVVEPGQVLAEIDVRQYQLQSGQTSAAVKAARVQRDAVKKEWERFKVLADKGAVPGIEFDRLDAQLAQAEAAVKQAEASARVTRHVAGESKVVAPFRGIVSKRHMAEGAMASPGAPLITLVDIDTLRVRGQVPAELLDDVEPGDTWRLRFPALDVESDVTIERVLPFVDPTTRRFEVLAVLTNTEHRYATGLFAEVRPATAVTSEGANPVTTTPTDETATVDDETAAQGKEATDEAR